MCSSISGLPDTDTDGTCDALDPCTNVGGARDLTVKPKLVVGRINADVTPGNDTLSLNGELVLPGGTETNFAALDPLTDGARVSVTNASGAVRLDVTLASGAYGGAGTKGWSRNGSGTKWTYQDKTTAPAGGITKVTLQDRSRKVPNQMKVLVKGKNGTYPVVSGDGGVRRSAGGDCRPVRRDGLPGRAVYVQRQ